VGEDELGEMERARRRHHHDVGVGVDGRHVGATETCRRRDKGLKAGSKRTEQPPEAVLVYTSAS